MSSDRTVLITGITGKQGGAVATALAASALRLRGLTRKPEAEAAAALAKAGVEIVAGDLDDETAVRRALHGVWGVFSVQNSWEAGIVKEEEQGRRLATLAREAGVQHFVYTSVGSAHRKTGIPHFESKWRIEQAVRELAFPSHVILRPVFFMENLTMLNMVSGDTLSAGVDPATRLQMIAVEDIGVFGARAFLDASLNRREIDLAGDAVTMPEAAATLGEALGRTITFAPIPIEQLRQYNEDLAVMFEWFNRVGYDVDIDGLASEFGFRPLTLAAWARRLSS